MEVFFSARGSNWILSTAYLHKVARFFVLHEVGEGRRGNRFLGRSVCPPKGVCMVVPVRGTGRNREKFRSVSVFLLSTKMVVPVPIRRVHRAREFGGSQLKLRFPVTCRSSDYACQIDTLSQAFTCFTPPFSILVATHRDVLTAAIVHIILP